MARSVKDQGRVSSIQERLTEAAHTFTQEILRVLSVSTLAELSLLTGRREELAQYEASQQQPVARSSKGPTVPTKLAKVPTLKPKKKPNPRISAVRKEAGTKPVNCPVPGCAQPGIRSKMNFCRPHAESMSRQDRVRMRQEQRTNKASTAPIQQGPTAEEQRQAEAAALKAQKADKRKGPKAAEKKPAGKKKG